MNAIPWLARTRVRPTLRAFASLLPLAALGCTMPNPEFVAAMPDGSVAAQPDLRMPIVQDSFLPNPQDLSGQPDIALLPPDLATSGDMAVPPILTFIALDANWRYLDDGSNQMTGWKEPNFNDMPWKGGQAELGYGDGDEKTVVGYGGNANNKFITTYFRAHFDTPFARRVKKLDLRVRRDDGVVIYLNGTEVVRDNMPNGNISYTTLASNNVNGADEMTLNAFSVDPARLVEGHNVVAVEIHQNVANSSDISFALELSGTTN